MAAVSSNPVLKDTAVERGEDAVESAITPTRVESEALVGTVDSLPFK
jgi:hypothetical protein